MCTLACRRHDLLNIEEATMKSALKVLAPVALMTSMVIAGTALAAESATPASTSEPAAAQSEKPVVHHTKHHKKDKQAKATKDTKDSIQ